MKCAALLFAWILLPAFAAANSTFPIAASGFWNGATTAGIGGTVGSYSFDSSLPSGSVPVAFCPQQTGTCNATMSVSSVITPGDSEVFQNGQQVGVLDSNFVFTASFPSPSGPQDSSIEVSGLPITVTGSMNIWSDPPAKDGTLLATYIVSGSGTADLSGIIGGAGAWFLDGDFDFVGTAADSTPAPEPQTWIMALLGAACVICAGRSMGALKNL